MIPVLLWRCPVCRTDDALRQRRGWRKPDRLWCSYCHVTWEVRRVFEGDYRLLVVGGDAAPYGEETPLAQWYDRMQATLELLPLHDPALNLEPGEILWAKSKRVRASREVPVSADAARARVRTERLGTGRLFLTSERLIWKGPRQQQVLWLKGVKAVWTIISRRLALQYEGSGRFAFRFLDESVLKWLTYIPLAAERSRTTDGGKISTVPAHSEVARYGGPTAGLLARCQQFLIAGILRLSPAVYHAARWLYRLEISGRENIPTTGPFLFVVNHPSRMDFLIALLGLRVRPDGFFWGGFRVASTLDAYRRAGIKTIAAAGHHALWSALREIQKGRPAIIAPEGGVRWDGRPRPLLPGAAWLALRSGAPVIVAALRGGYSIWPRWAAFPELTGRLEIRIGRPFHIRREAHEETGQAIEAASRRIVDEMARLEAWS